MRDVFLSAAFKAERDARAPLGTTEREAIERILDDFENEALPLPGIADHRVDIPMSAMGRTVPASNLVVVYAPFGDMVSVLILRRL